MSIFLQEEKKCLEEMLKELFFPSSFQLWERLDGRGRFVWEQNVGWEVL